VTGTVTQEPEGPGSVPAADVAHHRVVIVGAGFSGIGLAIRLVQRGTRDFVVFERGDDVGGTWRDNSYPGAACDVPSNLYSFSFAPNPSWSRSFSPQPEIQAYLRDCANRFGVLPHVRLRHEVTGAVWDDSRRCWWVDTTRGRVSATVLVSARGPLSEPRLPDVPGLEEFRGAVFHSARWDHDHDLRGERVAVIGTGASAIQFVPEVQPVVRRLSVFQRTAPWIIPRRDRELSAAEHLAFRFFPPVQLAARAAIYWAREAFILGFVGRPARRRRRARIATGAALRMLERQVPDPELRAKLTPSFELGCKRVLLSSDYYRALSEDNVEVLTEPITRVSADGVVTADGREHEVDTILLGTGFDVTAHAAATCTVGRGGRTLAEAWEPRISAYKGMTVHGFPNLFLMVGPNSGLGHSSIVFIIESQLNYVLGALDTMASEGVEVLEVTRESQMRWTAEIDRRSSQTVWTGGGCKSYYVDAAGRNVALWPGTSWGYRRRTRRFDVSAYRVERPRAGWPAEPVEPSRVEPARAGTRGQVVPA
jgi:cation diffusion facilitator CzcD-associated flavoprotein CzcO